MDKYQLLYVLEEKTGIIELAQLVTLCTERAQWGGRISRPCSYAVDVPPHTTILRTKPIPTVFYMDLHGNIRNAQFLL